MNKKMTIVLITLLKGMLVPLGMGLLLTCIHYPLGMADCHFYGSARDIPTKYVWFQCYVHDNKHGWLKMEEYQRAVIGSRVILGHD